MTVPGAVIARPPDEPVARPARRRRRPVARFVGVLVALGLLLGALAWSGLVWPQARLAYSSTMVVGAVEPSPDGGFRATELDERDVVVYDLVNLGHTAVEVRSVVWGVDRPHEVRIVPPGADSPGAPGVVTTDRLAPFVPFSIPGGATRTIALAVNRPCPEAALSSPLPDVRVEVASPTGRVRTLVLSEGAGPAGPPPCP